MKLAQLHPYPPEIYGQVPKLPGNATQGGGETSSFQFAKKLAEHNHQVVYCCAKYPGIEKNEIMINKNFKVKYYSTLFRNAGPALSVKLFLDLLFGDFDVIQSHQIPIMFSIIGGLAAKIRNKKFIMTFHGRVPGMWIDLGIARIASFLADYITVQNNFSFELVSRFTNKNKIRIIPHGVDTNHFKIIDKKNIKNRFDLDNNIVILFVGRLLPSKGLDVLIKAFNLIQMKEKNIKLVIVGKGPMEKILRLQVEELHIEDKVLFPGLVSQEELPSFYSLASVFVLPSTTTDIDGNVIPNVSENFGNVLAESMSCGTPVIASRMGGIPNWIQHKVNGLLFTERDHMELASLIKEILNNKELKDRIIENALNSIKNYYSWDVVIKSFEKLYQK